MSAAYSRRCSRSRAAAPTASKSPHHAAGARLQSYLTHLRKDELAILIAKKSDRVTAVPNLHCRSDIWKHFKRIALDGAPQPFAQCDDCGGIVSYTSQQGTGSLIRHKCSQASLIDFNSFPALSTAAEQSIVELHHRATGGGGRVVGCPTAEASCGSTRNEVQIKIEMPYEDTATATPSPPLLAPSRIPEDKVQFLVDRQLQFISGALLPPEVVDDPAFMDFAQAMVDLGADFGHLSCTDVLANSEALSRVHFPRVAERLRAGVSRTLASNDCSFAVDVWSTDPTDVHQFLTLSAHAIDEDFRLNSMVLKTEQLFIEDSLDLGVHSKDLVMAILKEYMGNDVNALLRATSTVVTSDTVRDGLSGVFRHLRSLTCACELLNKALDPVLGQCNSRFPRLMLLIDDTRRSVASMSRSSLAVHLDAPLRYKCTPRWNTTYDMLDSVTKAFPTLQQVALVLRKEVPSIRASDMTDLLAFLEPFKDCSQSLGDDTFPTLNECILWKLKLEKHCMAASESPIVQEIQGAVLENLRQTFVFKELHYVALFLDPNFKALKMLPEDERKATWECVTRMLRDIESSDTLNNLARGSRVLLNQDSCEALCPPPPPKKLCSLAKFTEFLENEPSRDRVDGEVRRYIENRLSTDHVRDILNFWKTSGSEFPLLRVLARQVLAVPASAASGERLFRHCGKVADHRPILDTHVHSVIFLNQNLKS